MPNDDQDPPRVSNRAKGLQRQVEETDKAIAASKLGLRSLRQKMAWAEKRLAKMQNGGTRKPWKGKVSRRMNPPPQGGFGVLGLQANRMVGRHQIRVEEPDDRLETLYGPQVAKQIREGRSEDPHAAHRPFRARLMVRRGMETVTNIVFTTEAGVRVEDLFALERAINATGELRCWVDVEMQVDLRTGR